MILNARAGQRLEAGCCLLTAPDVSNYLTITDDLNDKYGEYRACRAFLTSRGHTLPGYAVKTVEFLYNKARLNCQF